MAYTKKELEELLASKEAELQAMKQEFGTLQAASTLAERQTGTINRVIDIVYPNVAHLAQWEELKFSVRSIEKWLSDVDFRIWIVGDLPAWANSKINHIPCPHTGKTPRIDILHKHKAVFANEAIGEEYFWMNDDIYFVNPVFYADMCLQVAVNHLDQAIRRMDRQTIWGRDNIATFALLKREKLSAWNYSAHIPHRYEKSKVQHLVEKYAMLDNPVVLEQIYYNYYYCNAHPYIASLEITNNLGFSVNRPNPNTANLRMQLKVKKWMNNGEAGMTQLLQSYLLRMFPDKCSFEK